MDGWMDGCHAKLTRNARAESSDVVCSVPIPLTSCNRRITLVAAPHLCRNGESQVRTVVISMLILLLRRKERDEAAPPPPSERREYTCAEGGGGEGCFFFTGARG